MVLLPGGTLWTYSYRQVIPKLARHFTVVAVDLPGQGYTTLNRHDFAYDLDAMSDALGSFMDAVGLPRASLVGHSRDGAAALYFTERGPERVSRLVLIDSPGLDDPSSWDFRVLELPVVGELIGKLMTESTFEATLRKGFAHPERLTRQEVDEYWAPLSRPQNRRAMWMLQRNLDYSLTDQRLVRCARPPWCCGAVRTGSTSPGRPARSAAVSPGRPCGSWPAAAHGPRGLPRPGHPPVVRFLSDHTDSAPRGG